MQMSFNKGKVRRLKLGFACDHVAIALKNELLQYAKEKGYECIDFGGNDPSVKIDYPEKGLEVAKAIKSGTIEKGILICGTGVGISLAANKVSGIRAAVCSEPYTAKLTVEHNNANILAMGTRVVGVELGKMILQSFLDAKFEGGRHQKRIDRIEEIEKMCI